MLDFIKPHTAAVLMLFPPAAPSPKHSKSQEHSLYCPLLNDLKPMGSGRMEENWNPAFPFWGDTRHGPDSSLNHTLRVSTPEFHD